METQLAAWTSKLVAIAALRVLALVQLQVLTFAPGHRAMRRDGVICLVALPGIRMSPCLMVFSMGAHWPCLGFAHMPYGALMQAHS